MNLHPLDSRTPEKQQDDLIHLNIIQDILEEDIGSFVIQDPENLYDQDHHEIIRKLAFSRGLKKHILVIAPDGFIRFISPKFPSILLQEIHNALLGIEIFDEDQISTPNP